MRVLPASECTGHRIAGFCAAVQRRRDEEGYKPRREESNADVGDSLEGNMLVCVTSGLSFLGRAIVELLLRHGYSVRVVVENEVDVEKVREMELSGEAGGFGHRIEGVMASPTDAQSLNKAFDGCSGVFHTSASIDPAGVSGYSRTMAELEVQVAENVMEACARTESIKKCVFTSSLLACIWQNTTHSDPVVNHRTWSDEAFCYNKKLWYALGKLKAEKAAWRVAENRGVRLATICPGLITGPDFFERNPSSTIAYLKGAQEMYGRGLLATVDVKRLAKAHLSVYKELGKNAIGRFISIDQVVEREGAEKLAWEMSIQREKIIGLDSNDMQPRIKLSDKKLVNLISRTSTTCNQ